jgi:hypothetical protein
MRGRAGDLSKSFLSKVSHEARVEYREERERDLPQDLSRKGAGTPVQIGIVDSCRGRFLLKRFAADRHTACTALRCKSCGAAAVVLVDSGVSRVLKGFRWNVTKVPSSVRCRWFNSRRRGGGQVLGTQRCEQKKNEMQ